MIILETNRTYLREFNSNDSSELYNLNLDPEVIKFTGDSPFLNIKEAETFISNYDHYKLNNFGRWAVINKENQEFIGWCGLKYTSEKDEYDIGFRFYKKYWNLGYATETAKACINYGFNKLNLKKIIGRVMIDNLGSVRVLEKIGLEFDAYFDFDGNSGIIYKIEN